MKSLIYSRFMNALTLLAILTLVPCFAQQPTAEGIQWQKKNGNWVVRHPVLKPQQRVNPKEVKRFMEMSDNELRQRITEDGSFNKENLEFKDIVYKLASLYHETKVLKYAHKAAIILQRFSGVIDKWPFNNFQAGDKTTRTPQSETPPHFGGFWAAWFCYDLEVSAPLVQAYDMIYNSGAMETLGKDVKKKIEQDLLSYNLNVHWRYPINYGNTDANRIAGTILWGLCLGDPELVHKGVRWMKNLYRVGYYADGSWHEDPCSYHLMTSYRLEGRILKSSAKGYSDPPGYRDQVDGSRFDNLDLAQELAPFMDRATEVARHMVLPNGRFVAIHDATWDTNSTSYSSGGHSIAKVKGYIPPESRPYLLNWFGHGFLGTGERKGQTQAHLHFSGTHGHEHRDCLNIILFAKGKELFGETHYRGNRAWQSSTAGHNTVVIDEKNQQNRGGDFMKVVYNREVRPSDLNQHRRKLVKKYDDVPEIPNFWSYRSKSAHGTTFHHGNLLLWEPNYDKIQVIEAKGENAWYPERPKLFRRTLGLIASEGADVYLVDIFRVKGGSLHDWMLHGNLEEKYMIKTNLGLHNKTGTLHDYITELKSAVTSDQVKVSFISPTAEIVDTFIMPADGTELILGEAPAMRRDGNASFLDIRRKGPENTFAVIHEPYKIMPRIMKVTMLSPKNKSDFSVALKVELDNRTDYVLSTLGNSKTIEVNDDGKPFKLEGRFGVVSLVKNRVTRMYLIDGIRLEAPDRSISARSFDGIVTGVNLRTDGMDSNSFIVSGELPEGEPLRGRMILLTDSEGSTYGFEIVRVERDGHRSLVHLSRDPGFRISRGVMKMLYFPQWGVVGEVHYHIPGVTLKNFDMK